MGGVVATHYVHQYPDRVQKLILVDPAVTPINQPFLMK
jgi:pimeloyl-ACP methyl ester carboxylesterase